MMMDKADVFTFADLKDWSRVTRDLDKPARLSVFGDPVAHSLSPQMHQPALDASDIDASYVRLLIQPDELKEALRLLPQQKFIGTNVTIPHKAAVVSQMHDLTPVARRAGIVNTVLVDEDNGQLIGHSTDGPGFERAIRECFATDLSDLRILILGAGGGAGRAVAVQCAMERCERLVLVNRTAEKAQALAAELDEFFHDARVSGPVDRLEAVPWTEDALAHQMDNIDLIVNATSLGMKRTDDALLPRRLIQPHHLIYDMVYSPPRTRLIADAEDVGARAANGLSMLLWQGALSYEFWFNQSAPIEAMREGLTVAVGG
jgi:shikimate dehydrogenase